MYWRVYGQLDIQSKTIRCKIIAPELNMFASIIDNGSKLMEGPLGGFGKKEWFTFSPRNVSFKAIILTTSK